MNKLAAAFYIVAGILVVLLVVSVVMGLTDVGE